MVGSGLAYSRLEISLLLCAFVACTPFFAHAQFDSAQPSQGLPFMMTGPDSGFAQLDFAQMYLDQQNKRANLLQEERLKNQRLIDSGVISALDLAAPNSAVQEFNRATSFLKEQNSKEAAKCLEKAIHIYPGFVSAHNSLGLAYQDQDDTRAESEFESASKLDPKFPGSFVNLGMLALGKKDYPLAESNLSKAASLNPGSARVLAALAFAENGNRQYDEAVKTADRVHALEHRGLANVHYIAAAAALSLNNLDDGVRELTLFLNEDPTNALAPVARRNLDVLEKRKQSAGTGDALLYTNSASNSVAQPNLAETDRLKSQLKEANDSPTSASENPSEANLASASRTPSTSVIPRSASTWTIRKSVDETALFFAVSSHGHMIDDLELSNIQLKDNGKAPTRVVQFLPQSKLPLRLALIIDTSGSVQERFAFEKHAAAKFLEKVLNGTTDLAFVAGFNSEPRVTQDFSPAPAELAKGIDQLTNGGGTALFDAVSFACWKLAAYPDQGRVARVLVILTDGEDNSSHHSLKQSIEDAEASGVTIYTVSTKTGENNKTSADKILDLLAERSGGESMFPGEVFALGKSLDRLRDLIRSRYLLAYKPADFEPNGKFRNITLQAEKDGKHLQVHVRKGYYARVEGSQN